MLYMSFVKKQRQCNLTGQKENYNYITNCDYLHLPQFKLQLIYL